MADVQGTFYQASKVRIGTSPSSPGLIIGTVPTTPVNPDGSGLTIHNNTQGKQGGDGTNFYHLGQNQYDALFNYKLAGEEWSSYIIDDSFAFGEPSVGSAFGNGVFIIGSSDTILRISQDLSTWNKYTGFTGFGDVTFGNGVFVMVLRTGTLNRVRTSTDGITWTTRTTPVDNLWSSVTFGNGLFVAISPTGSSNRIMTSPDGITWTTRTNPEDNEWKDVTFGNGLFVAVSDDGTNRVMTSPDGITWTERSVPSRPWEAIAYKNGLFVACNGGSTNNIMHSSDGISWTEISISGSGWSSIAASQDYFVVVGFGSTGSPKIRTSLDGSSWTTRVSPYPNTTGYTEICFGNDTFLALASPSGNTDAIFAYSKKTNQLLNHSQLNLNDGRNPHETRFIDLTDAPNSYSGQGGKNVGVKSDETGLEFVTGHVPVSIGSPENGLSITSGQVLTLEIGDGLAIDGYGRLEATGVGTIGGSIASGQVAFGTGANTIAGDNSLFWDNVNKRLGVLNSSPTCPIDVIRTTSGTSLSSRAGVRVENKSSEGAAGFFMVNNSGKTGGMNFTGSSYFPGLNNFCAFFSPESFDCLIVANGDSGSGGTEKIVMRAGGYSSSNDIATFNSSGLNLVNGKNIVFSTTTGTKIATATSQKLSFWNATPIIQPTTSISGAIRVGGGGNTITDTDTFGGYTVAQIAQALINIGLLA